MLFSLSSTNQLDTLLFVSMFTPLSWISDEKEREAAHSEFISVNDTDSDWIQRLSKPEKIRTRRQAVGTGRVKTIETAIFVDHHLKSRFEGRLQDLKRLVLATMNEVQLIYNYQSMKIPIRIVITKFEILKDPKEGPNNADGDIDKYLDNFCSWQARKYRAANQSSRWDHSLLLTGYRYSFASSSNHTPFLCFSKEDLIV